MLVILLSFGKPILLNLLLTLQGQKTPLPWALSPTNTIPWSYSATLLMSTACVSNNLPFSLGKQQICLAIDSCPNTPIPPVYWEQFHSYSCSIPAGRYVFFTPWWQLLQASQVNKLSGCYIIAYGTTVCSLPCNMHSAYSSLEGFPYNIQCTYTHTIV